jgi:hypothetical protein
VSVTHAHVSAVPDDPAFDIGTGEWNAAHVVSVTHAETTGKTANDHHNQSHGNADHTGPLVLAAGTVTLASTTQDVALASIGANSKVLLTMVGANPTLPFGVTVTAGVKFTILSDSGDGGSDVQWVVVNP